MTPVLIACVALTLGAGAVERAEALFQQVEGLSRNNQKTEALAKAEEAVVELDRARAAGEKIGRPAMEGLKAAARLAREDFLDHRKSLFFCDKMLQCADSDYWKVPARLEMALTYRAMGDFKKAQEQYDTAAAAGEPYRPATLVPQAEMVYFDVGDRDRGRALLEAALRNEAINAHERIGAIRRCAQRAMADGRRDEALRWYAIVEKLPFEKAEDRARFLSQAWCEMGKIEESRGRTAEAKADYRKALELEGGEMRYRARARDALESIEYFE